MAGKFFFIILVVIIGSAIPLGLHNEGIPNVSAHTTPMDGGSTERMLRATVQITMVQEETEETVLGTAGNGVEVISQKTVQTVARGIGTLVALEDGVVLVTHNHWPQVVDHTRPDRVNFRDAAGEQLLEIDGLEFQKQILYRDSGTMIVRAPARLVDRLQPVAGIKVGSEVNPGDVVHVVRRQPGATSRVGILPSLVIAVDQNDSHSVLTLQTLDGESIEQGDSGGGIWSDGALVGNMWMTVGEMRRFSGDSQWSKAAATDRSRAAGLTEQLLESATQSLQSVDEAMVLPDGLLMD